METKKKLIAPVIEVVHFDEKDVITTSTAETRGVYNIKNITDFFNIGVSE